MRRSRGYAPEPLDPGATGAPAGARRAAPSSRTPSAWPADGTRSSPTTSVTWRTTRPCARSPRASRTSGGCSTSQPEVVAHDLHPEYLSTKYALDLDRCRADRGAAPPRAHRVLPGRQRRTRARSSGSPSTAPGYGTDGTLWGGEFLLADLAGFQRAGAPGAGPDAPYLPPRPSTRSGETVKRYERSISARPG